MADLAEPNTPDDERWRCPWCDRTASLATPHTVICDTRRCNCGAIALGAPPYDFDEVVDDAINIFGIDVRYRTPFDADRVRGLQERGVEIREGCTVRVHTDPILEFRYFWFRREAEP